MFGGRRWSASVALLIGVSLLLASPADAQRRRRRPTGPGHLIVSTAVEGAEVLIDETSVGFTPLAPIDLEPGSHTVRVRKPGYTEFDDVVEIASGEDHQVLVDLIALAMVLTVRSTPDEARVFVDGTFRGQTPIELELIDGEHSIRVTAPRFRESIRNITAIPGQTDLIDVTLEAIPDELIGGGRPVEWYEEPLTWVLLGGGAALAAAAIIIAVVVTSQGSPFSDYCGADEQGCFIVARPAWTF